MSGDEPEFSLPTGRDHPQPVFYRHLKPHFYFLMDLHFLMVYNLRWIFFSNIVRLMSFFKFSPRQAVKPALTC